MALTNPTANCTRCAEATKSGSSPCLSRTTHRATPILAENSSNEMIKPSVAAMPKSAFASNRARMTLRMREDAKPTPSLNVRMKEPRADLSRRFIDEQDRQLFQFGLQLGSSGVP